MEYLGGLGLAWVLNSWQIDINRFPKLCEEVTIGTVPYMLRGPLGLRNFFMDTADGERLAVANSIWTLFDFNRLVPTKVTPEIVAAYPIEEKLDMNYEDRKIIIPADGDRTVSEDIVVKTHHLDTNNHVNNGQYIRMALDSISNKDISIRQMRAEYKKQARLGDILHPVVITNNLGDNIVYTVALNGDDDTPVCVVQIKA
jgi:acyl-ACP thioesterase